MEPHPNPEDVHVKAADTASPTRDRLMDSAEELMLSKGYVAASVGEIWRAAGVTKGSFFHHFDCKETLGKALLERFTERQNECFTSGCCGIEDPLERVLALVDAMIGSSQDPDVKGCLVGVFAQEISETHTELREICDRAFRQFAAGVARDLAEAKERHAPAAEFETDDLGNTLLALAQGSMLLTKTSGDRKTLESTLTHYRRYLEFLYDKQIEARTSCHGPSRKESAGRGETESLN